MAARRCFNPLLYWCSEREAIRKKKEQGLTQPWTSDLILQQYRFCNLRRRDDRVSQWLIKNVLSRRSDFSDWSFIQFTALCRWINWPPTLIDLRERGLWPAHVLDLQAIGAAIDAREEKAWTGAYMIRAPKPGVHGKMKKGKFVAETVIGECLEAVKPQLMLILQTQRLALVWAVLTEAQFYGRFMAGQIVTDWSYSSLLEMALDTKTWAPQGPGSVRGFNRLMGLPLRNPAPSMDVWCDKLIEWREDIVNFLGREEYSDLQLMDVQNALCETDKLLRVRFGEGRPRATYSTHKGLY